MAFTYGDRPDLKDRDFVRWYLGDTDEHIALQTDGEIDGALAIYGDKFSAAAAVADAIAATFAQKAQSTTMGKLSIQYGDRATQFRELAKRARAQLGSRVSPHMVAHRIDRKQAVRDDSDRVRPGFARGMHDMVHQDGEHQIDENSTAW